MGFPWQLILIHRTLGFRHPGLDVGCDLYFYKMQSISHRSKAAVTQKWDVECGFSVVCFSERCRLQSQWDDCCIGRVIFRMIVRAIHSVEIDHELVMSVAFLKTTAFAPSLHYLAVLFYHRLWFGSDSLRFTLSLLLFKNESIFLMHIENCCSFFPHFFYIL